MNIYLEDLTLLYMKTLRKIKIYTAFALLIAMLIFSIWDGCQSKNEARDFGNQMAEYNVKEQGFIVTISRQGKKITRQTQIIVTNKQAIQQGLIENTRLKKIKSQVKIITRVKIEKEFIPFNDYDIFDDTWDEENLIVVPKPFGILNEWYWIGGKIVKKGIEIDSIQFFNRMTITIGDKRLKGFKNILKRRIPTVEIVNESPYVSVEGLQNVVIKKKPKKWFETTGFKVLVGFGLGIYTAKNFN